MNNAIKLLLVLSLSATLLTGCNTARGVGEDIQGLGHAISRGQLSAFLADLCFDHRFAVPFRLHLPLILSFSLKNAEIPPSWVRLSMLIGHDN
jgi:entericidin A